MRAAAIQKAAYGAGYDGLLAALRFQGRLSEVPDFDTALRIFSANRVGMLIAYSWTLAEQPAGWHAQVRYMDWQPDAPDMVSGLALSLKSLREADRRKVLAGLERMR